MSTQSKRQRTIGSDYETNRDIIDDADEGKEEKIGGDYQPIQFLPSQPPQLSLVRDWFCANTAFSKQTCMQRTAEDVDNWTTSFRSGLEGGMTAEDCKRTCGTASTLSSSSSTPIFPTLFNPLNSSSLSSSSSSSSSSLLSPPTNRIRYNIPGSSSLTGTEVPGVNPVLFNTLIASMLRAKDLSHILPTSRASYVGMNSIQKAQLQLESLLVGLVAVGGSTLLGLNQKYYLDLILKLLQSQGKLFNRLTADPLLIEYLPKIYNRYNGSDSTNVAFFTLLNELPPLEKFAVIYNTSLNQKDLLNLIEQGTFEFDEQNIVHDTATNRNLWNTRDIILLSRPENIRVIDWFLPIRLKEELLAENHWPSRTHNLRELFKIITGVGWLDSTARIFLERGYYLPLTEFKVDDSSKYNINSLKDPLMIAIRIGDPELIDRVTENYKNPIGVSRITGILQFLSDNINWSIPLSFIQSPDAKKEKFFYDALLSILKKIQTENPSLGEVWLTEQVFPVIEDDVEPEENNDDDEEEEEEE